MATAASCVAAGNSTLPDDQQHASSGAASSAAVRAWQRRPEDAAAMAAPRTGTETQVAGHLLHCYARRGWAILLRAQASEGRYVKCGRILAEELPGAVGRGADDRRRTHSASRDLPVRRGHEGIHPVGDLALKPSWSHINSTNPRASWTKPDQTPSLFRVRRGRLFEQHHHKLSPARGRSPPCCWPRRAGGACARTPLRPTAAIGAGPSVASFAHGRVRPDLRDELRFSMLRWETIEMLNLCRPASSRRLVFGSAMESAVGDDVALRKISSALTPVSRLLAD